MTLKRRTLTAALLLAIAGTLLLALPAFAAGSGVSPVPPDGVSQNGKDIHFLYNLISIPAILIFLLVEGLLLYVIIKFRRKVLPAGYVPPQIHGNTTLEVIWTVIPFVILVGIGAASFFYLQKDFQATELHPDMELTVVGRQFGWDYHYPDGFTVASDGLTPAPMVVPVGKLVRLKLQSHDVIHSWWVPEVTGKTDLVPGYDNFTWLKIDEPGEWRGQCAELCGAGHYTMQLRVKAVSQAEYASWVTQQKAAATKAKPAAGSAPASPLPSASPSPR